MRKQRRTTAEQFWSRVDKSPGFGPDGDCWMWTGCVKDGRYGVVGWNYDTAYVHRLAYFLTYNEWPDVHTHHKCQNKLCVNPGHMKALSPRDHGLEHRWTICKNGHELTPENTYTIMEKRKGYSVTRCAICRRENQNRYRLNKIARAAMEESTT